MIPPALATLMYPVSAPARSNGPGNPLTASPSSARLLKRAREGDQQALERLFARHLPRLYVWARGRLPRWARDLADTADLVQDTLLRAFSQIDRFEPRHAGALQSYLRQAVFNRIRDEYRRAERRPAAESLDEEQFESPRRSPLEDAIDQETSDRYSAALRQLGADEQRAVVARIEMGYSYEQIALMLGKRTPDAARVSVNRALVRLAREMRGAC